MVTGQQVAVDDALSGEQNLVLFGRLWGPIVRGAQRAAELLEQFSLVHAGKRRWALPMECADE